MKTQNIDRDSQPSPPAPIATSREKTLVWDLPVRVFHWSLALAFTIAFVSSES